MFSYRRFVAAGSAGMVAAGLAFGALPAAAAPVPHTAAPMVVLAPAMVELESGFGNPGRLVDEQDKIRLNPTTGLPDSATSAPPLTHWATDSRWFTPGHQDIPLRGYIDLGAEYALDAVSVWKTGPTTEVGFSIGAPGDWTSVATFDGAGYRWTSQNVDNATTRYLRVELMADASALTKVPEIAIFGTPTGGLGKSVVVPSPIPLTPEQVFPVTGLVAPDRRQTDGTLSSTAQWFDEQDGMTLPLTTIPKTSFTRTGAEDTSQISMNEIVADVDFRRDYRLEYIAVYADRETTTDKATGQTIPRGDAAKARLTFSSGEYGDWSQVLEYTTAGPGWTLLPVRELTGVDPNLLTTRFLRVSKDGKMAPVSEIVFYGTPVSESYPVEEPTPVDRPNAPMNEFFGTNSFVYTNIPELMGSGGAARIYAEPSLNGVGPNADSSDVALRFSDNSQDQYYQTHHASGVDAFPTFSNGLPWLATGHRNLKPIADQLTAAKTAAELADVYRTPASYTQHASMMFQYAARYGSVPVDESRLRLAANQTPRSGLGTVRYFENWNEPDAHWAKGAVDQTTFLPIWSTSFTAEEFAAMTSADYDGHEGTLGSDRGVKNADPKAQLVLGGQAGSYSEYIKAMDYWFAHNRQDGEFAADVINIHHYSGTQAPEASGAYAQFREVVGYSEDHLGDRDVWVSEFGWDVGRDATGACSDVCAGDEATQASWILREYLIGAAAGVDRMQQYMLADDTDIATYPTALRFASSGLLAKDGADKRTKRPSWFAQLTARSVLDGTSFAAVVSGSTFEAPSTGAEDVHVLRFSDGMNRDVYAVWVVDDEDSTKNFTLAVPGAESAVRTVLENLKPSGTATPLTVTNRTVALDVSTTPVFVTVSRECASVPAPEAVIQAANYQGAHAVELTAVPGAEIRYTTDYSTPTQQSARYEGPITLNTTGTVRAIAIQDGVSSPVAAIPVVIWDLPGGLSSLSLDGQVLTPSLTRAETYYEAVVDSAATSTQLTATVPAPGTQITLTINGEPALPGQPHTIALSPGLTTVYVVATQRHTGNKSYATVRIAQHTELGLQVIVPAAVGTATNSTPTKFATLWDESPTLNEYYLPVNSQQKKTPGGGHSGVGYIDLGENWQNLRLTGTWTQYRGWANGQQTPYAELWWDTDTDTVNQTGSTETRFNFSTAARVGTLNDNDPLWIQDTDLSRTPVTPSGRYLMFREQTGTAERAIELALTGYIADDISAIRLLRPTGAGAIGTAFTPMERLFDGDTEYDPATGVPSLTNPGGIPYTYLGRPAYIDLGPDWQDLQITQIWGHYRAWSNVTGASPVDVFWDNDRDNGTNDAGITDSRLALHATAVSFASTPQWSLDSDFSDDPLVPRARYIIIVPKAGVDWRMDELALVGYQR